MGDEERHERRATGVQKVVASDGNGGKAVSYHWSATRAKTWVGVTGAAFTLLLTVAGAIWMGLQFGIHLEAHEVIVEECGPDGIITDRVEDIVMDVAEEVQGVMQDDLDDFDIRLRDIEVLGNELKTGQSVAVEQAEAQAQQITRNQDELKMLIQRAIDNGGG